MIRRLTQCSAPLVVALSLASCMVSPYGSEGFLSDVITLHDLNPKVLPLAIEVDADPKDTIYKSKARYKPGTAPVIGSNKDQRLLLRGKKDGAAIRAQLERDFFATEYELHVRVAFDPAKINGLVDGQSLAFFDLVLDTAAEGAPPLRRIEAVYDAANNGFDVRTTDDSMLLGTPLEFPGASEVVLQFRFDGANLISEAGVPTGAFVTEFTPTQIHTEVMVGGGAVRQTVGWGALGLGKKGTFFINQLTLGGLLPDIGTAETPIAMSMQTAYLNGETAASPFDFTTVANAIETTRANLETVRAAIQTGLDQSTLGPVTQGTRALKNIDKALKAATKGKAIADKQMDGAQKTKPINKKARQALKALQLAFAQIAGFKSNGFKRLTKSGFLPFF